MFTYCLLILFYKMVIEIKILKISLLFVRSGFKKPTLDKCKNKISMLFSLFKALTRLLFSLTFHPVDHDFISIDITYFNPHILQVGIARLTYMVIKHMSIEIIYKAKTTQAELIECRNGSGPNNLGLN